MKNFQVFKHPFYGFESVKTGFSWPALFLGIFWILFARLWANALIWIVIYLSTIYISGTQTDNIVFQLVSIPLYFALWLVPAFEGNAWLSTKLQKRGFEFQEVVQASSKDAAIAVALNKGTEKLERKSNLPDIALNVNSNSDSFLEQRSINLSNNGQGAYIVGAIIALFSLFLSLLISKPNESAFLSYLFNENRIQAAISAEIKPGDSLAATALLGDFFDFIASGNESNFNPTIRTKDYRLFVLYSTQMNLKPYDGKFTKLKRATNVDVFRSMGFNSTFIGFWGTFFRLNNTPFTDGIQIKVNDDGSTRLEAEEASYNEAQKKPSEITYEKAVSLISNLPYVISTANQISKASNGTAKPQLVPGNEDGREIVDGESYFSVHLIEDHEDHIATIDQFLVSLNGKNILVWDIGSEKYKKLKHQTPRASLPAKEAPIDEEPRNVETQDFISNTSESIAE